MSHSKNTQPEKSYGSGSDIKMFTGKTYIKKLDDNSLMAKDKALKSSTTFIILKSFTATPSSAFVEKLFSLAWVKYLMDGDTLINLTVLLRGK